MTRTSKVTFSTAIAYAKKTETWHCTRLLNQREPLSVIVFRGRRWRADRKQMTTAAALRADGWVLHWSYTLSEEGEE